MLYIYIMMIFLSQNGATPLSIASENGHLAVVRELLEANAAVNQQDVVCTYMYMTVCMHLYNIHQWRPTVGPIGQ